jgi:N utilization substance protein B
MNTIKQKSSQKTITPKTRSAKRSCAFQLFYSLDRADYDASVEEVMESFSSNFGVQISKEEFSLTLFAGVLQEKKALATHISTFLKNWDHDRISCSVRLILHLACWELLYEKTTPEKVIINEYVELAKGYAEPDSYRFINGILDQVAKHKNNLDTSLEQKEITLTN